MKIPTWTKWIVLLIVVFTSLVIPMVLLETPFSQYGEAALLWSEDRPFFISIVVILALTADIFLPVPNGLTNTLAGVALGWPLASIVVWIGLNFGAIFGYLVGRFAARPFAQKMVGKDDLSNSEELVEDFSVLGLILSRPVPVFAELLTLAAGMMKMPFSKFCYVVGFANIGVALVFAGLGAAALASDYAALAFLGAAVLPALFYFLYKKTYL